MSRTSLWRWAAHISNLLSYLQFGNSILPDGLIVQYYSPLGYLRYWSPRDFLQQISKPAYELSFRKQNRGLPKFFCEVLFLAHTFGVALLLKLYPKIERDPY
jgi:hypothetical protein